MDVNTWQRQPLTALSFTAVGLNHASAAPLTLTAALSLPSVELCLPLLALAVTAAGRAALPAPRTQGPTNCPLRTALRGCAATSHRSERSLSLSFRRPRSLPPIP